MRMCDRIAVMNDGSVEQVGSPAEVYEEPATPFVADFVGTSNLLSATAVDGTLDFGFGAVDADVPMDLCGEVTVSARPSDFEMGGGETWRSSWKTSTTSARPNESRERSRTASP